jgi:hypothetical protein
VSTQVVALTGHDLIQNVPQQTVNIVREDTRTDNSLVRQPTAGQNDRNIGHNPVTQTMDANERVEMYSRVSPPKEHQNNSACCVSSDTPAGDTRGGMVIETPSPGPNSQSGIGGYSGIGAIRTPQQHGRFISSTEKSVYSENNSSSLFLATGRSVEIGRGGGGCFPNVPNTRSYFKNTRFNKCTHFFKNKRKHLARGIYSFRFTFIVCKGIGNCILFGRRFCLKRVDSYSC